MFLPKKYPDEFPADESTSLPSFLLVPIKARLKLHVLSAALENLGCCDVSKVSNSTGWFGHTLAIPKVFSG